MSAPPCADECRAVLREQWAKACRASGVPAAETHITWEPPLGAPQYEDVGMRCPHGVLWHMQPTSEQVAEWVKDGVE